MQALFGALPSAAQIRDDLPDILVAARQRTAKTHHLGVGHAVAYRSEYVFIRSAMFPRAIEQIRNVARTGVQFVAISPAGPGEHLLATLDRCRVRHIAGHRRELRATVARAERHRGSDRQQAVAQVRQAYGASLKTNRFPPSGIFVGPPENSAMSAQPPAPMAT